MRISICDDDSIFLEQLLKYLVEFFKKNHIKCPEISIYNNGESLLQDTKKMDIVFLDVEMPGLNGIATANFLKKNNRNIILFIVTAYSEYLDEAMRVHVFRYLSKPLEKQRLFRNMRDALNIYSTANTKIAIETKHGVTTVSSSEIILIESANRRTLVHTLQGDFLSVKTIAEWQNVLPANCFFQSHKSFIINFRHVTNFDHELISLCNHNFKAYLTRRKYSAFKAAYLLYLESMR